MTVSIVSVLFSLFLTTYTLLKIKNKYFLSFIVLIVFAYVLVGPFINFFELEPANKRIYYIYQPTILVFFYIPFLFFTLIFNKSYTVNDSEIVFEKLPLIMPIIIFIFLSVFIYVIIDNNLLFRRMGHSGLYEATSQLNIYQKLIYRIIAEASFFVVLSFREIMKN